MGKLVNGVKSLFSKFGGAGNTQMRGSTYNQPLTGAIGGTDLYSAPIAKTAQHATHLGHVQAGATSSNGVPNT